MRKRVGAPLPLGSTSSSLLQTYGSTCIIRSRPRSPEAGGANKGAVPSAKVRITLRASDDFLMKPIQVSVIALVVSTAWGCVSVQVRGDGPNGEVIRGGPETEGVTEAELGLPFYPGSTATPVDAGGYTWFKMDGLMTVSRSTADPLDKVLRFYEGEITSAKTTRKDRWTNVKGDLKSGADVEVLLCERDGKTLFQINVTLQDDPQNPSALH